MKDTLLYILGVIIISIWTTIFFIYPDFIDSPLDSIHSRFLVASYIVLCGIGSFFLLYIICSNKYLCLVILPIWSIAGATLAFYRVGYHTTLTPMLIDVTLHTNIEEALGVISWQLIVWIMFNLCFVIIYIWWRWKKISLPYFWLHGLIACLICFLYFTCDNRLRNSLCQRFPYNIPYNIKEYKSYKHSFENKRRIPQYISTNIPDSLSIILILGESVRADHLQINGYKRETTPLLATRCNLISYPNIYCEQTHTLAALPYILTRADSVHEELQYTETSFISIFKNTGFKTAWLSNQDMGSTFTHFLTESDTIVFANAGKSVYVFSQWLDEDLIPLVEGVFNPTPTHTLYILHAIGSHWYYDNHVPNNLLYYRPTTTNRVITTNSIEQINNSYDNTIRYMDFFVDSLINSIEDRTALVIYQSDHGEALGENGEYLHANDAQGVHNPACFIWYSDKYAAANPEKIKALIANKDKRYRTDYVFYSILYAAGIEAEGDNPDVNIFKVSTP